MKKYNLTINGTKYSVDINDIEDNKANIEVNGTPYTVELDMESIPTMQKSQPKVVRVAAPAPKAAPAAPAAQAVSAEGTTIASPMPGAILGVNVSVGQAVKAGDVLMILEAMKMENDITAPCDGTVKQILVSKGSTVNTDDVLIVI